MSELASFIAGMPKAELHLHIEGTLEPELKFELAARNGLALPYGSVEEMRAAYDFNSLASFLTIYYEGMNVLVTEQDFYDLAMAYFRKAHSQNVVYAEIFFDPQGHTSRGIAFETVVKGFRRAQQDAEASFGLQDAADHVLPARPERRVGDGDARAVAARIGDWIVGVGLDSDERGNPPVKFKEVFARARNEGYRLTMHCDVDQENSVGHIWQCLDEIKVERVDHGVNALEDPALIKEINKRGLGANGLSDLERLRHGRLESAGDQAPARRRCPSDDQLRRPRLLQRVHERELRRRPASRSVEQGRARAAFP